METKATKKELARGLIEDMIQAETFFDIFSIKEINQSNEINQVMDCSNLENAIIETISEDKIKEYSEKLKSFYQGIGNEPSFMNKFFK